MSTNGKYRATKALVDNGMRIADACKKTGMTKSYFYILRKNAKPSASEPAILDNGTRELPLEEQVIASDLSAKAKVKILTTLLNA